MSKKLPELADVDKLSIEELAMLSAPAMTRVLHRLSPERKVELLDECEEHINHATAKACMPGQLCADPKEATRFAQPYTLIKKYSYLYTCIAGYQTKDDLMHKEFEQYCEMRGMSCHGNLKNIKR